MTAPWVRHFGLHHTPFTKSIPSERLFPRAAHREAVARIQFCLQESAFGVLLGEVGIGKTVAVRAVSDSLDPTRFQRLYVADPGFGTRGIYVTLVNALGARPRFHLAEVIAQAQSLLAHEHLERHRQVLLVIDEAHMLSPEQLEVLRVLTNADCDSTSHLTLILLGQPTLARRLKMGQLAAVDQRILTRYTIPPMDLEESTRYLQHHLAVAGRTEPLFTEEAIERLHQLTRGVPRSLNNAATAALITAAAQGKKLIDDACARQVVAEFTSNEAQP